MRLLFGLIATVVLVLYSLPVGSEEEKLPDQNVFSCVGEIMLNREMETLILGLGCEGREMAYEEAVQHGRGTLDSAGFPEYNTLYDAIPMEPVEGKSSVWALIYYIAPADPHA